MTFFNIVSSEKLAMGQVFRKFVIKVYLRPQGKEQVEDDEQHICQPKWKKLLQEQGVKKIQISQHLWDSASKLNCN